MSLVKTRGIVMKHTNLGEADKIITLFTEQLGKIHVVAHGSRKSKSKLLSSTQIFSYSEYVLYRGRNLFTVSQAETKESFQVLLDDLYTLTYSSYIMELVDSQAVEEEANIDLFMLVLKALYLLTDKSVDKELLIRAFELLSMIISGFMPELNECSLCKKSVHRNMRFSARFGGIICEECRDKDEDSMNIDASTINVMRFIIKTDIEKVRKIKISKENKNEMKKIMKNYIKYYLEKDFKSLEFLDDIKLVDNL